LSTTQLYLQGNQFQLILRRASDLYIRTHGRNYTIMYITLKRSLPLQRTTQLLKKKCIWLVKTK